MLGTKTTTGATVKGVRLRGKAPRRSIRKEAAMAEASSEIATFPPEGDDLGFLSRILVQVALPHSNPGNDLPFWVRENGSASLTIRPGIIRDENGEHKVLGYPFGTIPRLLFMFICREALRMQSPKIGFGNSLSEFMSCLGMQPTGGRNGTITRLKDQIRRLVSAEIIYQYHGKTVTGERASAAKRANIADEWVFFWDARSPDQKELFGSHVVLHPAFFEEIMNHPVVLDLRIVEHLRQSPLALDLYTWLTHRVSYLQRPQRISWQALATQVGSMYKDIKDFKRYACQELRKIGFLWQGLNVYQVRGGIVIQPSPPSVPPAQKTPQKAVSSL